MSGEIVNCLLMGYTGQVHFRLLCPSDFPGKDTRVDCHFLLQGLLPTLGWNLGLLHYRQIFYRLSYKGSPI